MALQLADLDDETRGFMLSELDDDVTQGALYLSARLSPMGRRQYEPLLRAALSGGDPATLAFALASPGVLASHEVSHRKGVPYSKRVPRGAHETLADGEFNRFYLRGLCRAVLGYGGTHVEVYRARASNSPRSASVALEGALLDAAALLADLSTHTGVDTALGLPPGPNSGLSARLPAQRSADVGSRSSADRAPQAHRLQREAMVSGAGCRPSTA